jgi:hypothetical protein
VLYDDVEFLWDLVDDGRADSVLRLRDMGHKGISVATAYHTSQQLRPHRPQQKLLIEDAAAIMASCQSPALSG